MITTTNLIELRKLAGINIKIGRGDKWYEKDYLRWQLGNEGDASFIACVSPSKVIELLDTLEAQAKQIAALQVNSERYLWLRDEANNVAQTAPLVFNAPGDGSVMKWTYAIYGSELDDAIDAARKGNV